VTRQSAGPWVFGLALCVALRGYGAFPSATTAITAALLGVLWVRSPARRISWIAALVLVGAALAFTNNHWLSDVIGGGFLGWTIGLMTEAIWRTKRAT
jgi:membrane-associated phospholipid phosphatase